MIVKECLVIKRTDNGGLFVDLVLLPDSSDPVPPLSRDGDEMCVEISAMRQFAAHPLPEANFGHAIHLSAGWIENGVAGVYRVQTMRGEQSP